VPSLYRPVPCGAWTVIGVSALPGEQKMRRRISVEDIRRLVKSVCKPVVASRAFRKRLRELLMHEVEVGAPKGKPTIITKGGQNGESS